MGTGPAVVGTGCLARTAGPHNSPGRSKWKEKILNMCFSVMPCIELCFPDAGSNAIKSSAADIEMACLCKFDQSRWKTCISQEEFGRETKMMRKEYKIKAKKFK